MSLVDPDGKAATPGGEFEIKRHIRFKTTVETAHWDDTTNEWELTVADEVGEKVAGAR
jgi:cation diffusion facilitator CzcD-associated flavoprotein CzcO